MTDTLSLSKKTFKKILIHVVIWVAFIAAILLQSYYYRQVIPFKLMMVLGFAIFLFYLNYFYLVPKFLLQKKTLQYVILVIILIFISIFIVNLLHVDPPIDKFPNQFPKPNRRGFFHFEYIFPMLFNLAIVVIGTSIRIYEEWNKNERKRHEIEAQKKTTELNFLKNQLNPHFLFNSLNSIYSLTNKKSNDAPEAVITLSELMRYMLYKTDNDFVLLKDELEYIQNYLKLQRLRIVNNENVTLNIHGNVTSQKIRPLLLISFIENAFKHGTDFMGNTEVKIVISIADNKLEFTCVNLKENNKKAKKDSGIGFPNTKERLDLLYPNKHSLEIKEDDNRYFVTLILNLE